MSSSIDAYVAAITSIAEADNVLPQVVNEFAAVAAAMESAGSR